MIPMASTEIVSYNILSVSAGSNAPAWGDDGETVFHLKDEGGATQMYVALNSGEFHRVDSVTLQFFGASERNTFLAAIAFGFGEIEKQRKAANRLSKN